MKNNQVNATSCERGNTWILPGLLVVSLVCNVVLSYFQQTSKPQPAEVAFASETLAPLKKPPLHDQLETASRTAFQEAYHWQELYEKKDGDFVSALKAMGMPDVMVHSFAIGRAKIEEREQEEQLLFNTPY